MKSYAVVFLSVLLAELGDKTQVATLVFATNPAVSKLGVFAALGFIAIGVWMLLARG